MQNRKWFKKVLYISFVPNLTRFTKLYLVGKLYFFRLELNEKYNLCLSTSQQDI